MAGRRCFHPLSGGENAAGYRKGRRGHTAIYDTPRYNRFRRLLTRVIARKWLVAGSVIALFALAVMGMGLVKKQFFPTSDRPEVLVEVQMPYGTSIEQTSAATAKIEDWLEKQPEARIVTAYIGQGSPRFYLAMAPELPDPSFAKIVILTDSQASRDALKLRLRQAVASGLAPEARVRVTQLVFGPYSPFPVAWRVMGPDTDTLRDIADRVKGVLQASPMMRTVNTDWGSRVPTLHFTLDQDRLQATGLTSNAVAQQLQFLLSGIPITAVREDIRSVQVTGAPRGIYVWIRPKLRGLAWSAMRASASRKSGRWRSEWKILYCVAATERPRLPCGGYCRQSSAAGRFRLHHETAAADCGLASARVPHRNGGFD
jgi:multidrug efflux pump subunit AcrB